MKPSVTHLSGCHVTAADKRNILTAIEFLRGEFEAYVKACPEVTPDYARMWVKVNGRKQYAIRPDGPPGEYVVHIGQNETDSAGRKVWRDYASRVRADGIEPLYMPAAGYEMQLAFDFEVTQ